MYFSVNPSKDNTITNLDIQGSSRTGSNAGQSEILELYVLTSSFANRGKSRILLQFNLDTLSSSIASGKIPSSGVQFKLRMKNASHAQKLPSSYDIEIFYLSRSWDEGTGLALQDESLKDYGQSNWANATSLISWSSAGGDYITTISASQHFDTGEEDINVDVTTLVYGWLTGGVTNNGLLLKYLDAHETGSADVFVKKFFSRHAHAPERRPRIEALWSDFIHDDRDNIQYNVTGALYYYRFINGTPNSVNGTVFVDIVNSSSTVTQTLTASLKEAGIYEVSGVLVNYTSSTQIFRDVWFDASQQLFTGTFTPVFATGSSYYNYNNLNVELTNLKNIYGNDEEVFVKVFAKEKDYRPAIRRSGSTEISPLYLDDAYYEIKNSNTEEGLVDFSTGSVEYSKISYDKNGNYFKFWTSSLRPDNLYKIRILTNYNGQKIIFDKGWIIKIAE